MELNPDTTWIVWSDGHPAICVYRFTSRRGAITRYGRNISNIKRHALNLREFKILTSVALEKIREIMA